MSMREVSATTPAVVVAVAAMVAWLGNDNHKSSAQNAILCSLGVLAWRLDQTSRRYLSMRTLCVLHHTSSINSGRRAVPPLNSTHNNCALSSASVSVKFATCWSTGLALSLLLI